MKARFAWITGFGFLLCLPAHAQFSIVPLNTFGTSGWLPPNGVNGGIYSFLTTADTERGLAYGNNHLYLVSRNGGDFIRILDSQTGNDLGALNLGSGIVSGGTFDVNMVAVGGDGAIYVANLAVGPAAFRVYRWTNDISATVPQVVYNGVPLAGARLGDSLAVFGSGSSTRLAAGFNSTPSVTGNNGYAVIDPTAGTATAVAFAGNPPAAGDFRLGISFTDPDHVIGTQGAGGGTLLYSSFSGANGTLLATPALASPDERPMSFAIVSGFPLLAALSTADNHVSIYNLTDPANPALVGQVNATSGSLPSDSHNTGAVAWGQIEGNHANLYAMATDDGIQAFVVTVPEQTPATITSQPQNQTVLELSPASFSVAASGVPAPSYQWYRNGAKVLSATNSTYQIASAAYGDNGAQFEVIAQNTIGNATYSATSSVATLTVIAKTNPPALLSAQALGLGFVELSFSTLMSSSTATNVANYAITSTAGGLVISNASLETSQTNVVLTVSPMTEGTIYTVTINNLVDQSFARNVIAPNSQTNFIIGAYTFSSLDTPTVAGSQAFVTGGYNITVGGLDIGGTSDQGSLSYQLRSGDFDVAVRLAGLSPSDVYAKAGLMARETLDPGSRFAAVLATPAMVGSFFEWRDPASSSSQSRGQFPVNYPNTWLRLKRSNTTFTGFASYDGQTWTILGSASITLPSPVYLGLAVSAHSAGQSTTAQFRDVTEVSNALVGSIANPYEPLGPSSRRTPIVITELMYHPAPRADGRNLEYIELYNSNPWWEDLSGYRLTGDFLYRLPPGTILPGGGFLIVAPAPADVESVYGLTNVLGPSVEAPTKKGLIQLRDEQDSILLDFTYETKLPWPAGADGTGHSIVLARPSYGEADPKAWAVSDVAGGSPGMQEAYRPNPLRNVLINEFLAYPGPSSLGYIELYNHSSISVDLSGCVLTDDPQTNKFTLPANISIAPGGYVSFDTRQMAFSLNPAGGLLLFKTPDSSRVLDAVSYEAQGLGVACGRWPDGASEFYPLTTNSPGTPNGEIVVGDIVLNEIMYKPLSGDDDDQFVELYNQGTNMVDLTGWTFVAGMHFIFSPNTHIAPGAYLVVARNQTNLFSHYSQLNSGNTVGDFTGKLPHGGGRLALASPELLITTNSTGLAITNTILIVEDEVTYRTGGRWGQWAHGGGSSLESINPRTNHRLAYNWADSDETAKSSWTNLEFTGVLDNGANFNSSQINRVQVGLLDVGECLVDKIEVLSGGVSGQNIVANGDFEAGMASWSAQGDHVRSSLETAAGLGGYQSSQSLHLRSSDGIWTLADYVQGVLTQTSLGAGRTVTMRLKARWLRGWPEVLMRLRGNWLEVTGKMPVPTNLGTPGLPNSRYVSNAPPAIFEVEHSPPLPPANQPLVVSARFHDPNPFQPTLRYRIDTGVNPTPSYISVPMRDDGTGGDALAGDGIYSATIPAQSFGTVVAFLVQARDLSGATSVFPQDLANNSGLPRECVVAFGDPIPTGSFSHHHVFITQNWAQRWARWGGVSHEYDDGTWVDGGGRIVYNWSGRYAGSPYHQYLGSPVTTVGGMHWLMPDDDQVFGTASFNKQHVPGNGPLDDDTLQREQTCYWMARQLGLGFQNRRYYFCYVNGNRHAPLMEDTQVPGADMLKQYWPNDNNGVLYKNHSWFEGDVNPQSDGYMDFNNQSWCLLGRFTTTINGVPGQYKPARYRWMYWVRQFIDSANNFTDLFKLIDAANIPASAAYYDRMETLVDTEEWMRFSALEHASGDWDSFFTQNQWNMYLYKPTRGKWTALKWDWNITLGSGTTTWPPDGSQLFNFGANDPRMARFQTFTPYRRAYLRAFKEIAAKAMNNTFVDPVLDKKYAAFVANGLTTTSYGVTVRNPGASGGLKSWIATMHNSLLRALTNQGVANLNFGVDGPTNYLTGTNIAMVGGTAPVEVATITVNGAPIPVTWTTVRSWQMSVPLPSLTNDLDLQALDLQGNILSNMTASLEIVNTNAGPIALNPVVINEWLANNNNILSDPADGQVHDWFELYNPNFAIVDLSGFYLTDKLANKTKWQIPPGTVMGPNGFLLVWADGGLSNSDHDLHANFKLPKSGSLIALFDSQTNLVDSVSFGAQRADVAQGRWPDGSTNIYFLSVPTAKAKNQFTNSPPALAPLPPQTVWTGNLLTFANTASDPDSPPQTLSFSLDPGAPPDAAINPTNGLFTWLVPANQPAGTNLIPVRVTDNGTPPLSSLQTVSVLVQGITLGAIGSSGNGALTFSWNTIPGKTYRIEWTFSLDSPWQTLVDLFSSGSTLTYTETTIATFTQRFYRVTMLP